MRVDWWNRRYEQDVDVTFADPVRGRLVLTTEEFVDAVRDLDRDLMAAMHERITLLEERRVVLPDVELDLTALRAEHHDRATWLQHALDRRVETDWTARGPGHGGHAVGVARLLARTDAPSGTRRSC